MNYTFIVCANDPYSQYFDGVGVRFVPVSIVGSGNVMWYLPVNSVLSGYVLEETPSMYLDSFGLTSEFGSVAPSVLFSTFLSVLGLLLGT